MQITTMAGVVYHFNPNSVVVITGPHQHDTDARVYLHGIAKHGIAVAGDAQEFVASLPNANEFAKVTFALSNKIFWVHAPKVTSISVPTAENLVNTPHAQSVLHVHIPRFIMETVDQARALINAAGGNV
jgi:hypothetical protein